MLGMVMDVVRGVMSIGDKMIVDQDKKIEFAFKTQELMMNSLNQLITMKTIPWVDAAVKILTTFVVLARPIGSFFLTLKGIDMAAIAGEVDLISGGLISLFPTWMGLRQYDKNRKKGQPQYQADEDNLFG